MLFRKEIAILFKYLHIKKKNLHIKKTAQRIHLTVLKSVKTEFISSYISSSHSDTRTLGMIFIVFIQFGNKEIMF